MAPFFTRCLEIAVRETRVVTLPHDDQGIPRGSYVFHEFYYDDLTCNCRRVMIVITRAEDEELHERLATISYDWESPEFYRKCSPFNACPSAPSKPHPSTPDVHSQMNSAIPRRRPSQSPSERLSPRQFPASFHAIQTTNKMKPSLITRRAFALSSIAFTALALTPITTVSAAETPIPKPDGKPADMSKPVQVFILLGQSNMVGLGRIDAGDKGKPEGSLEHAVRNKIQYSYLVNDAGNWSERKDVRFVRMMQGNGLMNNEWMGVKTGTIGPEFGIGHVVGNAVDAPVMILKSCIGNRALGWHLLPPGSSRFEEGDKVYAGYRDAPDSWAKGTEPVPPVIKEGTVTLKGDNPAGWYAGKQYDDDTADAKKVLADLDKHYPGAMSYEVAGFFYWQGEKDAGNPVWAAHYEKNLVQLIKALRKNFNAPNAKFVLGTMGESVKGSGGNGGKILDAQLAVDGTTGKYPDFKGNVATIYTHDMAQGGSGNGHYGGKAEVYMDVGEAMGWAMAELMKK